MEPWTEVGTYIIGALSGLALGGFKWLGAQLGGADRAVNKVLKPFQPLMVAVLAALMPLIANVLPGIDLGTPEAIAAAPASAVAAVIMRELWRRFVKPLLDRQGGLL